MKSFISKRFLSLALAVVIVLGAVTPALADPTEVGSGATYFTDDDNWGGGAANSAADGDLDIGLKNQNKNSDTHDYSKYPFEFKIEDVQELPQTSAYLLVRGLDVDEEDGEWDRVYFSSNAADIVSNAANTYTPWPASWNSGIADSNVPYKNEFKQSTYLGALSGNDSQWNTTVLQIADLSKIALGDNYVGISIHSNITTSLNTNWQATLDWGQLVIDGGVRRTGEFSNIGVTEIAAGKATGTGSGGIVTLDVDIHPKVPGSDYVVEVSIIDKVTRDNLGSAIVPVTAADAGKSVPITITESKLKDSDPNKIVPGGDYEVQVILFDDPRENGIQKADPKEAQHLSLFSTGDPSVRAVVKAEAPENTSIAFAAADFKTQFYKQNGLANGNNLTAVRLETVPAQGELRLSENGPKLAAGAVIPAAELDDLAFYPADGQTGEITFTWNGNDGSMYANLAGDVQLTINGAPTVNDIVKGPYTKGIASVDLGVSDFTGTAGNLKFVDPEEDALGKIRIVAAPDKGELRIGATGTALTDGTEISLADLANLKYIPDAGQADTVQFQWNGYDGLQYAADAATVTIEINTPPVVGDVMKSGLTGETISFDADDFALDPAYSDDDSDPLDHVRITLPHGFDKGTLWYAPTVGAAVYLEADTPADIAFADLDKLKFQPSGNLPNGGEVIIPWQGHDGKSVSDNSGSVHILYNGTPVAQPQTVGFDEGTPSIEIVVEGSDNETVTGLVYNVQYDSEAIRGTLEPKDPGNPNGSVWIYTPATDFVDGEVNFTFTVTDGDGQESAPAAVKLHPNKILDGWVGGNPAITTPYLTPAGENMAVGAVSSLLADTVIAAVYGPDDTLVPSSQTALIPGSSNINGTSWSGEYAIPSDLQPGEYTVKFTALKEGTPLPAEINLVNNHFKVIGAELDLTADPEKLIGNGTSTTELTAVLKDSDGQPIEGVTVTFDAPEGTFVLTGNGTATAVTNADGTAVVTYRAANLAGVDEKSVIVSAKVDDTAKGLKAQDAIEVIFSPARISGIITKGGTNVPVPNATVRVTLDLNKDGRIEEGTDFIETVTTDENGAYSVPVPKSESEYGLEITQTVTVGGVETPVTYSQKAQVGEISGSGDENFQSEETATGIVLFKQPDGKTSLVSSDIASHTKVYLKDKATGEYIKEGGVPKAFELGAQGVFNADGLTANVDYELEVRYVFPSGEELVIQKGEVTVKANGEMNITEELVDPYGTITDAVTNAVIPGATVNLYYADTQRNNDAGRTPGTGVVLPALVGFAPNDNASPQQISDANGFYAYMVYPNADYYLVVTKPGYNTYTSPTIPVGLDIVKHDLKLQPVSKNNGVYIPPAPTNVSLDLSVDKNLVEEGGQSVLTVRYINNNPTMPVSGEVKVTLPEGVKVIDPKGGTVEGGTIAWPVANLGGGEQGSYDIVVEWPQLNAADAAYDVKGEFKVAGDASSAAQANADISIKVFSSRFGHLQHQRYILGFPDGLFKPNRSLTRAELAAIVARLTDNRALTDPLPFKDVRAGHWATNYIRIVTKYNLFGGYEDGTFRPDAPVKRGELAAVMTRFLKLNASKTSEFHFTDTKGYWAADAVEALYRSGYLTGYPDGSFKPQNDIVRTEAVTLINRMLYRGPLQGLDPQFPDVPAGHWAFGDVQEATVSHESTRNEDGSETWVGNLPDDVK